VIDIPAIKALGRRARKQSSKGRLWLRGSTRGLRAGQPGSLGPQNVYFATVQRSGSQWIKHVFSDPRVVAYTDLAVYPQHRYEWNEFRERFPLYTFVPGLYMSYDLYEEIEKPDNYWTFYVLRDPRSIAVSWYWAALETHTLLGKIGAYRADLQQLDFADGLTYSIKALAGKFTDMRTWAYHAHDPRVRFVRFEELTKDPLAELGALLEHCRLEVPESVLASVLDDYTKAKMRERDLARRPHLSDSHYRSKSSHHADVFTAEHYRLFEAVTGDLVSLLGYDNS
jgi:hypothetical protein